MSPAQRRSRIGRAPEPARSPWCSPAFWPAAGQTTQAAPSAPSTRGGGGGGGQREGAAKVLAAAKEAAAKEAAAAQAAANVPIAVLEGGRATRQMTPEAARKDGLTVVDLSDDWLPYVFSQTRDKPQPLRPFLLDLANGRMRQRQAATRARARTVSSRCSGSSPARTWCGDASRTRSATPATTR